MILSLQQAQAAIAAVMEKAKQLDVKMNIALVDRGQTSLPLHVWMAPGLARWTSPLRKQKQPAFLI